jgi:hypothetical protein
VLDLLGINGNNRDRSSGMTRTKSNQDRNKQLSNLLADAPHPAQFLASNALRGAQVRWLLDLADVIDALGLECSDELTAAARNAAFGLIGAAVDTAAQAVV